MSLIPGPSKSDDTYHPTIPERQFLTSLRLKNELFLQSASFSKSVKKHSIKRLCFESNIQNLQHKSITIK